MWTRLFHYNQPLLSSNWNTHTKLTHDWGFLLEDDLNDRVEDATVPGALRVRLKAPWSVIDRIGFLLSSDEDAYIELVDGIKQIVYLRIHHYTYNDEPQISWEVYQEGDPVPNPQETIRLFFIDLSSGSPHSSVDTSLIDWSYAKLAEKSYRRPWRGIATNDSFLPQKPIVGDTWIVTSDWSIRIWNGNNWEIVGGGGGGGVTDHGALTGLLDDDHPQYSLVDGSRDYTGKVRGVSTSHTDPGTTLVTKDYVDSHAAESNSGNDRSSWGILFGDLDVTSAPAVVHLADDNGDMINVPAGDHILSVEVIVSSSAGESGSGTPAHAGFKGTVVVYVDPNTNTPYINGNLSQELNLVYGYNVNTNDLNVYVVSANDNVVTVEVSSDTANRTFRIVARYQITSRIL